MATELVDAQVTAADIARMAGVTRAAVANWRRRFSDFPTPSSGSATSPTFTLTAIEAWLTAHHKDTAVSDEVRLWQYLRAEATTPGSTTSTAAILAALGTHLSPGTTDLATTSPPGGPNAARLIAALAGERTPRRLYEDLHTRYLASADRSTGTTPARLATIAAHFSHAEDAESILDPACGTGNLLLACSTPRTEIHAQDCDPDTVHITRARCTLAGRNLTTAHGDSLRADGLPNTSAHLVVCDPPTAQRDWGHDELVTDPRWEFGLPPRTESELAWLQHCYAHTAPGGTTLIVMPAAAAARRTGRRIRSAAVRSGALTAIAALPPRLADGHPAPVHLWLLNRPEPGARPTITVRFHDLSDLDEHTNPLTALADPSLRADIARIDLLDDEVDLTPSRHVLPPPTDLAAAHEHLVTELRTALENLHDLLPSIALAQAPHTSTSPPVPIARLIRAGALTPDTGPNAAPDGAESFETDPDRLDADFVHGFLDSRENRRRQTSTTGTHRRDLRAATVPALPIEAQRHYGEAFRRIATLEAATTDLSAAILTLAKDLRAALTDGVVPS